MRNRMGTLVGLLCGLACSVNVTPGGGEILECTDDGQCPGGLQCNELAGTCIEEAVADTLGPALLAPSDLSQLPQDDVVVVWSSVTGAVSYTVQISESPTFDSLALETSTNLTSVVFQPPRVGAYYWRARSNVTVVEWAELSTFRFDIYDDTVRVYCPATESCDAQGVEVGTPVAPFRGIQRGLAAAVVRGSSQVWIAGRGGGEGYQESISVIDGIDIIGGYDATFGTAPDATVNPTVLTSSIGEILQAQNVTTPTLVQGLTFRAEGTGRASAVRLAANTAALTLDTCTASNSRTDPTGRAIEVITVTDASPAPLINNSTIECRTATCVGVAAVFSGLRVSGSTVTIQDLGVSLFYNGIGGIVRGPLLLDNNTVTVDAVDPFEVTLVGLSIETDELSQISDNQLQLRGDNVDLAVGLDLATSQAASVSVQSNDIRMVSEVSNAREIVGARFRGEVLVTNNTFVIAGQGLNVGIGAAGGFSTRIVHNTVVLEGTVADQNYPLQVAREAAGLANNLLVNVGASGVAVGGGDIFGVAPGGYCSGAVSAVPGSLRSNVFVGTYTRFFEDWCADPVTPPTAADLPALELLDGASVVWAGNEGIAGNSQIRDNALSSVMPRTLLTGAPAVSDPLVAWLTADLRPDLSTDPDGLRTAGLNTADTAACGASHPDMGSPYDCGNVQTDADGAARTPDGTGDATFGVTPGAFEVDP